MTEQRIPDEFLAKVEPEWKEDMLKFLDTGESRQEFMDHLDGNCVPCSVLLDHVLLKDSIAMLEIFKIIKKEREETKRKREEELKKCGFWKRLWDRISGRL